ncbi:MAG: sigma-70 family RNA polymerase sigma factor [Candidatus Eisenbacteria bacterium]|uniref:Sigma-70 family RNA polymerase sigma factor n=1 Tax=Eiseniibacteriota bacterium TaxID=2212470 RepID=A0A849SIR7_UNCEI|nr:sigma-70 family RNA polymerase sigma factor [Candidatus Eisenbacteria bacterium]
MSRDPERGLDESLLRDEARLVTGLSANDAQWVERFVRGAHRAVYAFATRLTPDPDLREEWTHVALLRILEDVREGRFVLRHPGGFWSWFRKRAYFLVLDQLRRARRDAARNEAEPDLDALPDLAPFGAGDPAREFERVELRADIERCLEGLSNSDHRRALELLLLVDLPYEEVAASLSSPLSTIKTWIRRGRISLRECLARRWRLEAGDALDATSH